MALAAGGAQRAIARVRAAVSVKLSCIISLERDFAFSGRAPILHFPFVFCF